MAGNSGEIIRQAAHRVRSHATVVGAKKVCSAAAALEAAAREANLADGVNLLRGLVEGAAALEAQLADAAIRPSSAPR